MEQERVEREMLWSSLSHSALSSFSNSGDGLRRDSGDEWQVEVGAPYQFAA